MNSLILIQKHLAEAGIVSRREGERLVKEGTVLVNGVRAKAGQLVNPLTDVVTLAPEGKEKKVTVAVHKPRGIVCSRNPLEGKTIFELLPQFEQLHVVGRLDKDSEGLLLLTNDGLVTRKITGADHAVEKEYIVTVRENVFEGIMNTIMAGVMIDGQKTLPCTAKVLDHHSFSIILKEGRKHQIRRMCESSRLTVESLKRIRVGNVLLGEMEEGAYRTITEKLF
jgi:23S rRNA pseudouridine2604 synthase